MAYDRYCGLSTRVEQKTYEILRNSFQTGKKVEHNRVHSYLYAIFHNIHNVTQLLMVLFTVRF